MDLKQAQQKEDRLARKIESVSSVLVAFSGGVDSSYLAFLSHRLLGDRAVMVTALSPSVSQYQEQLARDFARAYSLNHRLIRTAEMSNPNYLANSGRRCYFCKSELYGFLSSLREELSLDTIFDGSNADDVGDYRPGRQAASEAGVLSPMVEVGLRKEEIRALSHKWGLPCWDLPAMPCLASRVAYGVTISEEKLKQVEEAEAFLRGLGFRTFRVRHHEELARIELARDELPRFLTLELFECVKSRFKELGYRFVTLDLEGFRSGSLNETGVGEREIQPRSS